METPNGDVKLFDATLGFESYAPHVKAPLLWLGSTNDFHGVMDDTYRTGALIPHTNVRYAFAPHLNHRFTPEFAVTRPLWFDQHLKKTFTFPKTPDSKLLLATEDHVPELHVTPDSSQPVAEVHVYYSVDPDPRARFWRSAPATKKDGTWTAKLPVLSAGQPLFAFANVVYPVKKGESEPHARPTERFAISSLLHTATPKELRDADVKATDKADPVIDDFTQGWRDWYLLEAGNPHHWEFSTRKLADPKWRGQPGQRLAIDVAVEKKNELVVVLTENVFRGYRGKQKEFVAVVKLDGGKQPQTVSLGLKDFTASDGTALATWENVDLLSLRAYQREGRQAARQQDLGGRSAGVSETVVARKLVEMTNTFTPAPHGSLCVPHEKEGAGNEPAPFHEGMYCLSPIRTSLPFIRMMGTSTTTLPRLSSMMSSLVE